MTDPISDFTTRLRNASQARLDECVSPHSKLKAAIAAILKAEGYICDFKDGADALAARFAAVATAQDYYGILDDEKTAKQMVWLKANRPELFATVDAARVAASERMADTPATEEPAYNMGNAQ